MYSLFLGRGHEFDSKIFGVSTELEKWIYNLNYFIKSAADFFFELFSNAKEDTVHS